MEPVTKFKLTTFLKYLLLEPWTEKFTLPNPNTICWALILLSLMFRNIIMLWISIILGLFFYFYREYKSGKYISWYRQRKMSSWNEVKKKIRREKKEKLINNKIIY